MPFTVKERFLQRTLSPGNETAAILLYERVLNEYNIFVCINGHFLKNMYNCT